MPGTLPRQLTARRALPLQAASYFPPGMNPGGIFAKAKER
ncbi:hypothetical protein HMPREF9413_1382 [Paenibacillus sp. HGF7]|nr:hypothetical protein HMPREF9413_1382 [Paenibacillus sp. HGF7]